MYYTIYNMKYFTVINIVCLLLVACGAYQVLDDLLQPFAAFTHLTHSHQATKCLDAYLIFNRGFWTFSFTQMIAIRMGYTIAINYFIMATTEAYMMQWFFSHYMDGPFLLYLSLSRQMI